jgi:putative ABC transport system substrate-binding protein
VLAIGDLAARLARRHIRDVPVVYSMVPAPLDSDLTTANLCGVPLNGGFDAQLEQLRQVAPEARRIGTIYDPHRMGRCFRDAKRVTASAGMELVAAHAHGDDPREIRSALEDLDEQGIDAFLLLMDPQLMDVDAFEQVARYAGDHQLVLAVPDPSLIVSDKSFSFAPGFRELGAYAGLLVRRIVEGKAQPSQIGISYPGAAPVRSALAAPQPLGFRDVLPAGDAEVSVELARDED